MPELLVEEQTFPFDSLMFGPVFVNTAPSCSSQAEEVDRVPSPLKSFTPDLNCDVIASHCSRSNPSCWLNVPAFYGLDCFGSPPTSPSEKGSPRTTNLDGKGESLPKAFSRSLSKLGGQSVVSEGDELLGLCELSRIDGMGSENGGDGNDHFGRACSDLNEFVNGGLSIAIPSVYGNSNGGAFVGSPVLSDTISALQKFLPSNNEEDEAWPAVDVYSSDEFRMYEFKVRKCMRGRSHDWTECPFAHPGEKARRRDPRRFHYSGTACPDFRKGSCKRGDACEYAHGVFECWLHPARYRTQPCKDGRNCRRRVCFFAHTPEQLRLLPGSLQAANSTSRAGLHSSALKTSLSGCYDGSPLRQALAGSLDSTLARETMSGLGHNGLFGAFDGHLGSPRGDQLNYLGKITHGGVSASLQINSPTSTLVGHHSHSPPLSPSLSPPGSPPMSPNSPGSWPTAWARNLPCIQESLQQQPSTYALQSPLSQLTASQAQASIVACSSNFGPVTASTIAPHGPSHFSPAVPAHRRHLDRLNSMPSVSIPAFEGTDTGYVTSPGSVSCERVSSQTMTDLMATIQQLELRARVAETNHLSPWSHRASSLRHTSLSLPGTPRKAGWAGQTDKWDMGDYEAEPQVERVESGRDLRAKIYGRLSKENPLEIESPDLDWVNELVK